MDVGFKFGGERGERIAAGAQAIAIGSPDDIAAFKLPALS